MARPLTLIIALSLILTIMFPVADATLNTPPARRHRILKKRGPAPDLNNLASNIIGADSSNRGVQNAAAQPVASNSAQSTSSGGIVPPQPDRPTDGSSLPNESATKVSQSPTATLATPDPSNAATVTNSNPGFIGSILGGILGNSSSTTSSSSTSSSSSSSSTSKSTSSSSPTLTSSPTVASQQVSEITVTTSSTQSPSPTADNSQHNVTKPQRNTIIVFIAIGASIGAAGLIWTIIRKWKFRPSSSFEDRMQPIDWQPTTAPVDDHDITEKLHRSGSTTSHRSFVSGNNNHDNLTGLPQHDFTAGAAHLAPVGGYADLQRGPSPLPDMHASPNYRSPSPYNYDIPNPHGTYHNNGAGGYQDGHDTRGY